MEKRIEKEPNSIAIVIPWLGPWPVYLNLFLESLNASASFIDYLIFTENKEDASFPKNFKVIECTLDEIKDRIRKTIGIANPLAVNPGRKLCDLKPAYGDIFSDHLKDYTFWGFGDLDIIFGRIDKYLPSYVLDSHDVITFRDDFISGPFTIFRNTPLTRQLYKESPNYLSILEDDKYLHFDEAGINYDFYRAMCDVEDLDLTKEMTCFTTLIKLKAKSGALRVYAKNQIQEGLLPCEWIEYSKDRGLIGNNLKRYVFYHFVSEKQRPKFDFPNWTKIPESYILAEHGVYNKYTFNKYKLFIGYYKSAVGVFRTTTQRLKDSFNHRIASRWK